VASGIEIRLETRQVESVCGARSTFESSCQRRSIESRFSILHRLLTLLLVHPYRYRNLKGFMESPIIPRLLSSSLDGKGLMSIWVRAIVCHGSSFPRRSGSTVELTAITVIADWLSR